MSTLPVAGGGSGRDEPARDLHDGHALNIPLEYLANPCGALHHRGQCGDPCPVHTRTLGADPDLPPAQFCRDPHCHSLLDVVALPASGNRQYAEHPLVERTVDHRYVYPVEYVIQRRGWNSSPLPVGLPSK